MVSVTSFERVLPGVYRLRTLMVNPYFVGEPLGDGPWVLIDAGMPGFTRTIRRTAERLFGRLPVAVLLTHGHFDHVGSLAGLVACGPVPVYAHRFELPFVDGRPAYEQLRCLGREFIAHMPRAGRYVPDRRRVAFGTA